MSTVCIQGLLNLAESGRDPPSVPDGWRTHSAISLRCLKYKDYAMTSQAVGLDLAYG